MKPDIYNMEVLKTASCDMEAIRERLSDHNMIHMLHAAIGMCTESAELLDAVKRHIMYGADLDLVNIDEELGDTCWYQNLAMHAMRMKGYYADWETVWAKNVMKLRARYGEEFTEYRANNRDLKKEREILEETK